MSRAECSLYRLLMAPLLAIVRWLPLSIVICLNFFTLWCGTPLDRNDCARWPLFDARHTRTDVDDRRASRLTEFPQPAVCPVINWAPRLIYTNRAELLQWWVRLCALSAANNARNCLLAILSQIYYYALIQFNGCANSWCLQICSVVVCLLSSLPTLPRVCVCVCSKLRVAVH